MKQEFSAEINSRGYWRVNFRPLVAAEKLTLPQCADLVSKHGVALRGWTYPHFPQRNDETGAVEPHNTFYQGWCDWENHREFWRMYQSGQYLHYVALREDWLERDRLTASGFHFPPGERLGIIGTIYHVTEFFEFLSRLVRADLYPEGVSVSVTLRNTQGRELWIEDRLRGQFHQQYRTATETVDIGTKTLTSDEILTSSHELALAAITAIFARFGWAASPDVIRKDQEKLLQGRP